MPSVSGRDHPRAVVPGVAFLLSQLGAHVSRLWGQRMAELGVDPRHVVLLRLVASDEGRSQQSMGQRMQLPPSRMVALVDELEDRGLIERRAHPSDRRVRALYLTDDGRKVLDDVMRVSAEHETALTKALTKDDRRTLIELLGRIVDEQGLVAGVHPGVAWGPKREG